MTDFQLDTQGNLGGDSFQTTATTTEGVLNDFLAYSIGRERGAGQLNAAEGLAIGIPKIKNVDEYDAAMSAARGRRVQAYGAGGLDGDAKHPDETYGTRRYNFLLESEGVRYRAYDDATGKAIRPGVAKKGLATVGIGFNMDKPGALTEWKVATGLGKKEFEDVRSGKRKLTDVEVRKLFDVTIKYAEGFVAQRYKGVNLPEHQRLALVSLAFNTGGRGFGPTMDRLVRGGDSAAVAKHFTTALNKSKLPGLWARRYREAQMFAGPAEAKLPDFETYMAQRRGAGTTRVVAAPRPKPEAPEKPNA